TEVITEPSKAFKVLIKTSTYFRTLFLQLLLLGVILINLIIFMIVAVLLWDAEKLTTVIITHAVSAIAAFIGIFLNLLPLLIRLFKIKKTDVRVEIKEEEYNQHLILSIIFSVLGVIILLVGTIRFFL
ncbi:MAG: hypothetical protein KGD64_05595, partial [Candidatus Heimdallarchaeota archaeon]|nr:hypothetical protein [Candidatus Heimdallarchaeota archaeon]